MFFDIVTRFIGDGELDKPTQLYYRAASSHGICKNVPICGKHVQVYAFCIYYMLCLPYRWLLRAFGAARRMPTQLTLAAA